MPSMGRHSPPNQSKGRFQALTWFEKDSFCRVRDQKKLRKILWNRREMAVKIRETTRTSDFIREPEKLLVTQSSIPQLILNGGGGADGELFRKTSSSVSFRSESSSRLDDVSGSWCVRVWSAECLRKGQSFICSLSRLL